MSTTVPTLQLGFSIATKGQAIDQRVIDNVLAMTGKGTVIRVMEEWGVYNPKPGVFNWDALDATIDACNQAGLPVCLPIHNPAPSVGFTTTGTGVCRTKHLIVPAEAASIATTLATRYKGKRVWYESFNEGAGDGDPACILSYTADPQGTAAVMSAIYQAVKAVDPTIHVGGPALLRTGQGLPFIEQWVTNLLTNGGGKVMDNLAVHYYSGHDPADTTGKIPPLRAIWQCFQAVAQKHGHPHLKLKITEYGYARQRMTPQQQSDYAMAAIKEAQASHGFIDGMYYWTAAPHDGQSPYEGNPPNQTKYPLYTAFQSVH